MTILFLGVGWRQPVAAPGVGKPAFPEASAECANCAGLLAYHPTESATESGWWHVNPNATCPDPDPTYCDFCEDPAEINGDGTCGDLVCAAQANRARFETEAPDRD
jgi:hypothetical protein